MANGADKKPGRSSKNAAVGNATAAKGGIGKQRSKTGSKKKGPPLRYTVCKADPSVKGKFVVSVKDQWADQNGFEVWEIMGKTESVEDCICGQMRVWYCPENLEPEEGYRKGEYLFIPKSKTFKQTILDEKATMYVKPIHVQVESLRSGEYKSFKKAIKIKDEQSNVKRCYARLNGTEKVPVVQATELEDDEDGGNEYDNGSDCDADAMADTEDEVEEHPDEEGDEDDAPETALAHTLDEEEPKHSSKATSRARGCAKNAPPPQAKPGDRGSGKSKAGKAEESPAPKGKTGAGAGRPKAKPLK